jgi:hypothetical protein
VDADVGEAMYRTKRNQQLENARIPALRIKGIALGQRRAAHRDRYRMLAGATRLHMHHVVVLVLMRDGSMMLVCSEAVMVLGMIVTGVLVDMERRDLPGGRGHDKSEQDRYEALHQSRVYGMTTLPSNQASQCNYEFGSLRTSSP